MLEPVAWQFRLTPFGRAPAVIGKGPAMFHNLRTALLATSVAAAALIGASSASADVIDFTGLPDGAASNPLSLPGATFTALGGFNVVTSGTLCAAVAAGDDDNCSRALQVDFDQASSGLSFNFWANNTVTIGADIGDVSIFAGAVLLGAVDVLVQDASSLSYDLVDLSAYSGVTRLLITTTDFGGVLYDDFTYSAAVPEPATWALLISGFGLAGAGLRRRRGLVGTV